MNNRLKRIQSQAIETRDALSYEKTEERKFISKLDMIIRGTIYVRWLLLISLSLISAVVMVFMFLFYPDTTAMLIMLTMGVIGCVVCWLGVVIQALLYERTISKTQQVLSADYL